MLSRTLRKSKSKSPRRRKAKVMVNSALLLKSRRRQRRRRSKRQTWIQAVRKPLQRLLQRDPARLTLRKGRKSLPKQRPKRTRKLQSAMPMPLTLSCPMAGPKRQILARGTLTIITQRPTRRHGNGPFRRRRPEMTSSRLFLKRPTPTWQGR